MGDAGITVDVEDLQSRVIHVEKQAQALHVKVENLSFNFGASSTWRTDCFRKF